MERAPLPPHERSWRHPSEVAADARRSMVDERASTTTRAAAFTGGTATILLVGIVVFALTPRGPGNPAATSSSPIERIAMASLSVTTASQPAASTPGDATPATTAGTVPGRPVTTVDAALPAPGQVEVVPTSTVHPLTVQPPGGASPEPRPRPVVTELGTEGFAVLPSQDVVDLAGVSGSGPAAIVVMRSSGVVAMASVIDAGDGAGLALVHLGDDASGQDGREGYRIAADPPDHDDVVTVMTTEPVEIEMGDVASVAAPATAGGAAVVDTNGDLVGLYVGDPESSGGRFIPVDAALGAATATPG